MDPNQKTSCAPLNFDNATGNNEEVKALVAERFINKPWDEEQIRQGKNITDAAVYFAEAVIANAPPSATRTRAINLIEEARTLANISVTHKGKF